jgi:hypothetical protein
MKRVWAYIADGSEHLLGVGQAHAVAEPDDDKPDVAGRLYVPDLEQRHGWREFYVAKLPAEKPGARPLGFRRPR